MPTIARILKRLVSSRPYVIRGASMTPSLRPGDQVLVDAAAYGEVEPARGDVVVFSNPHGEGRRDIKRVIGLPGERVVMAEGILYVGERQVAEPYLGGLPSSGELGWASRSGIWARGSFYCWGTTGRIALTAGSSALSGRTGLSGGRGCGTGRTPQDDMVAAQRRLAVEAFGEDDMVTSLAWSRGPRPRSFVEDSSAWW